MPAASSLPTAVPSLRELSETTFAEAVALERERIFGEDLTLAEIVKSSALLTNSIDLMEAFARTASALRRSYNIRVRLPSFPLDTKISVVFAAFREEAERLLAQVAPATPFEASPL